MKKIFILLLTFMVLSSQMVCAEEKKEKLKEISFIEADSFIKIYEEENAIYWRNGNENDEVLSLVVSDDVLENYEPETIIDVNYYTLTNYFDKVCRVEYLSEYVSEIKEKDIYITIDKRNIRYEKTISGIPIYVYELEYTGKSSGIKVVNGVYTIVVASNNNDMYSFEYVGDEEDIEIYRKFTEMVNSISFGEETEKMYTDDEIKIRINGYYIKPDSETVIINDRTMCPIRAVAEKLGYSVDWDGETRSVCINGEGKVLVFPIGGNEIVVSVYMVQDLQLSVKLEEKERIKIDVPAQIISDRTYLPLRAVGEALGCSVEWDAETRTVIIES